MRRYEVIEPFQRTCPRCGAVFVTQSSNPRTCCPECRKAKKRKCKAEEQRRRREREKKRQWRAPLPPPPPNAWWLTEPRPLSLAALYAIEADEHLREKGIVIRRNGRPLADWYRELIATAGLTRWKGEIRPDAEFYLERSATPLSRVEAQDVEGRRTYRR